MKKLATTSLETAASGWTPKKKTRTGVMRAPPPIPVRPTTMPTSSPATAIAGSHQSICAPVCAGVRNTGFVRRVRRCWVGADHRTAGGSAVGVRAPPVPAMSVTTRTSARSCTQRCRTIACRSFSGSNSQMTHRCVALRFPTVHSLRGFTLHWSGESTRPTTGDRDGGGSQRDQQHARGAGAGAAAGRPAQGGHARDPPAGVSGARARRGRARVSRCDPEVRDYLDRIIDQMQELAAAVTSVLVPSGPSDGSPPATVDVDVDEVVDSVVDAVRVTWSGSLERRGMRGVRWNTRGDRVALRRCVLDVVDNAVRAAGPDGTVTVSVHPSPEGGRIVVDDDGPGFGRGPHGVGIGLAITRQTLDAMAAGLTVGPGPAGNGCRVVLCLGAEPGEPSADSSRTG